MCKKYSFIVSDAPFQIWWGKGVDSHSVVREMYPASRDGAEVEWTGDLKQDLVVRHEDPKMAKMIKGLILDRYPTRADLLPLFSGWVEYCSNRYHYQNGELDCKDGPAIVRADGGQSWYKDGQLHREDGPAIVRADGTQFWYKDGQLHRDSGPAIIWADGSQEWYKDGQLHREDGPARIWPDGEQVWYKDGQLHREDGPARIGANGSKEWGVKGRRMPEDEFWKKYKKDKK